MNTPTTVIYHGNCSDGFAAALAVKLSMTTKQEKNTIFIASHYKDEPPVVDGHNVIILDFSYPRKTLLKMKKQAKEMVVLDHHKSAQETLEGLDFCHFDMSKSGAVLAWEFFNSQWTMPKLFEYIQDRDLWKWELPKSKEVSAAIRSYPMDFDIWENWVIYPDSDQDVINTLAREGEAILRYQEQQIAMKLGGERGFIEIQGYEVPIINTTSLMSEMVGELAKAHPFAVGYFDLVDRRVFSLRSNRDNPNAVDVSKIANLYGGGGHANAAGFFIRRGIEYALSEIGS